MKLGTFDEKNGGGKSHAVFKDKDNIPEKVLDQARYKVKD
jgi:hypothetical protein